MYKPQDGKCACPQSQWIYPNWTEHSCIHPRDGPSLLKLLQWRTISMRTYSKCWDYNGTLNDTVSGRCSLLSECRDVDWTLQMSNSFALISNFIHQKDCASKLLSARMPNLPSDIRILTISAKDSTRDWIPELLHDEDTYDALSHCCDFSVQNDGKMLVIEPNTSISCGWIIILTHHPVWIFDVLACDCNWDMSHLPPPCCCLA